jgi:NADH-quinone oxidoreductase subunit L
MLLPLLLLAIGALIAGLVFAPAFIGEAYDHFWKGALFTGEHNHILHEIHDVPAWVKYSPFVMMILGFLLAFLFYVAKPHLPRELAESQPILYRFLLNKWYFDEIYDFVFVNPAKAIGRFLWKKGDGRVIDGLGPDGVAARVSNIADVAVRLQTGYLYHYAFAMLIGLAVFVTWYMFGGAH